MSRLSILCFLVCVGEESDKETDDRAAAVRDMGRQQRSPDDQSPAGARQTGDSQQQQQQEGEGEEEERE